MWEYFVQTGLMGIGIWLAYQLSPKIHDLNTTRELLKKHDLDQYLNKKQNYSDIISRIGKMTRHPEEATRVLISQVLNDLRNSPFYEAKTCKAAYTNLRILTAGNLEEIPADQLCKPIGLSLLEPKTWFVQSKSLDCTYADVCTKADLLRMLYPALANDGETSGPQANNSNKPQRKSSEY